MIEIKLIINDNQHETYSINGEWNYEAIIENKNGITRDTIKISQEAYKKILFSYGYKRQYIVDTVKKSIEEVPHSNFGNSFSRLESFRQVYNTIEEAEQKLREVIERNIKIYRERFGK